MLRHIHSDRACPSIPRSDTTETPSKMSIAGAETKTTRGPGPKVTQLASDKPVPAVAPESTKPRDRGDQTMSS